MRQYAVSGSVGGNIAMLAFYPLDQLVMRAQASTSDKRTRVGPLRAMMDVINTEGISGLYRGLNSTLVTLFVANFIYFYAFHLLRALVRTNQNFRKVRSTFKLLRLFCRTNLASFSYWFPCLFLVNHYMSCSNGEMTRKVGKMLKISRAVSNLLLGTIAGAINVCFVQVQ